MVWEGYLLWNSSSVEDSSLGISRVMIDGYEMLLGIREKVLISGNKSPKAKARETKSLCRP